MVLKRIAAFVVFSLLMIVSQLYLWPHNLTFAQSSQNDSIEEVWVGPGIEVWEKTEIWKELEGSSHNVTVALDLWVNEKKVIGEEGKVTGYIYIKNSDDGSGEDRPIYRGTWANGRLDIEWDPGWTLTAKLINNKLVGTYRYYWHSGSLYADKRGSFELSRPLPGQKVFSN